MPIWPGIVILAFRTYPSTGDVAIVAGRVIPRRSQISGGVNTAFMDGSVRFITNAISQATWRALGTRNGSEVVDLRQY